MERIEAEGHFAEAYYGREKNCNRKLGIKDVPRFRKKKLFNITQ